MLCTALCWAGCGITPACLNYMDCVFICVCSCCSVKYSIIKWSVDVDSTSEWPPLCVLQIVSSKTLTRPLQLKKGKPAGKGTITVRTESVHVCAMSKVSFHSVSFAVMISSIFGLARLGSNYTPLLCADHSRGDQGQQSHCAGTGG